MPIDLEIVSPEKLLLSRPVEMVVIPAAEGEMGVLGQHAPMIVLLQGGTIQLYGDQVTERLFVSGGFAEITPQRVTVLANEVTPPAQLSRSEGERRLEAAEAEYAAADTMDVAAQEAAMERMQSARAMIEVAEAA
jgi:F-type H+-transporting ATPase subunit epsilon